MNRVKRSKKRDERNVNDPFKRLPNDINVVILMKLPPRSIARLRFASKHLSSIILDKEFTKLYMTPSSTQPRHLISVHRGGRNMQMQRFHSLSQDHPSFSNHEKVSYKLDPNLPYEFTPPVRGLICGRKGNKIIVGNPSTGQFVSLPKVKTRRQEILSVFGYDPVNDVYKVLCMTVVTKRSNMSRGGGDVVPWEDIMSEEHQEITVGAKQKWRMVECKHPHRHYSGHQGICRDGVMYYLASYKQKRSLMSFNLSSEDFNVTKLPEDQMLQQYGSLTNHTGKITISSHAYNSNLDLWVLEDANKEVWTKVAAVIPPVSDLLGWLHTILFRFWGILRTGEMIFAPLLSRNPFFFICYDPKDKKVREIAINGIGDDSDTIQVFFDHVESCMIL
ncbi:hypothetical protein BRARA_A03758 [Brassica rapa]|uniref:F-box domain-containing protein n=1 Tax=Brassica campestris TaxID=3711 RepID=A0A398AZK5_BRACM|nr:hypothetical protein BRARA_A03758 [Brassica rapa]